jgi:hypothetical protein
MEYCVLDTAAEETEDHKPRDDHLSDSSDRGYYDDSRNKTMQRITGS